MLHQAGIGVAGPVFRAHDPAADRLVAVKAITIDMLPEAAAALGRELQRVAATRIEHPAAVAIFDSGVEKGRPFVVADYVAGESLDIARRHLAPFTLGDAVRLLGDIAGAIDAAWTAGVGHGALHPRDIFIVPAAGPARVTGFGIAQALERVGLKAPMRRPYTAPERAAGRPWDQRADVYTLGVIAQELFGGRRLATGDEPEAPLAAVPAARREEIREVLDRALASEPADRYSSAMDFVHGLAEVATSAGFPIAPPTFVDQEPAVTPAPPPVAASAGREAVRPTRTDAPAGLITLRPAAPAAAKRRDADRMIAGVIAAHPRPPRATAPAPSRYPWAAIVAVGIAGLMLGSVGGYGLGRRAAPNVAAPVAPPVAAPADTEVTMTSVPPLAPAPVPEPQADRVQPAARTSTLGPGRIVVRSVPAGALVTVDGRHAGETPVTVSDLPLGAHTVVVARPGYVPRSERITLSMRDTVRQLTVELRRGVDVREAQLGSIYVDSRPRGARVVIDGRFIGTTPLSVPEVAVGEHRIQLELEGHLTQTSTVTVRAGEQARVTLTLGREETGR